MAVLGVATLVLLSGAAAADASQDAIESFKFGAFRAQVDGLDEPSAVAVGPSGNLLVVEQGGHRLAVLDPNGLMLRHVGGKGSGAGEFLSPSGIDIDPQGRLFVADTGNHRVQVFSSEFDHEVSFGSRGAEAGQFNHPRGLSVIDDLVYVADSGNDRIQVFDLSGNVQRIIGRSGREDGEFIDPLDVAPLADGYISVVDAGNNRVQVFTSGGQFVRAWGDWGPFPGLLDMPCAILAIGDTTLVVDQRNHRIQAFDAQGTQLWEWGQHAIELREGEGRLHYPSDVAIAPDETFAIVCESLEDRIQIFDCAAESDSQPARMQPGRQTHFGSWLDVGGGFLIIGEPEGHFLYLFDTTTRTPTIVSQFGRRGWGHGQFIRLSGLAWDAANQEAYVADQARSVIMRLRVNPDNGELRFDPFRIVLVQEFDIAGMVPDRPSPLLGAMARSTDGETYIVDERAGDVLHFDSSMQFSGSINFPADNQGLMRKPIDIALSADETTVLVVDAHNSAICEYRRDGTFLAQHDLIPADGTTLRISGITVSKDGHVFVCTDRGKVYEFEPGQSLRFRFGSRGVDHEQFWKPRGLAVDDDDNLFIVDYGNHRCQIYDANGRWLMTFGSGRAVTRGDRLGDD